MYNEQEYLKILNQAMAAEANQRLTSAGIILKVAGATASSSGNVHAVSQSVAAGTEVAAGTVITVRFSDGSVTD